MKFKVGDKVKGISNEYFITNKDMLLGEVTRLGTLGIEIKILEHKDSSYVGEKWFAENADGNFEIVKNLTCSQLKREIKELSNKVNYLIEQLQELINEESKKEEDKPILDEVEKKYLKAVIKPFKDRIVSISKEENNNEDCFICIELRDDVLCLPYFKENTMYRGMELDKKYTLKELGLDE